MDELVVLQYEVNELEVRAAAGDRRAADELQRLRPRLAELEAAAAVPQEPDEVVREIHEPPPADLPPQPAPKAPPQRRPGHLAPRRGR